MAPGGGLTVWFRSETGMKVDQLGVEVVPLEGPVVNVLNALMSITQRRIV